MCGVQRSPVHAACATVLLHMLASSVLSLMPKVQWTAFVTLSNSRAQQTTSLLELQADHSEKTKCHSGHTGDQCPSQCGYECNSWTVCMSDTLTHDCRHGVHTQCQRNQQGWNVQCSTAWGRVGMAALGTPAGVAAVKHLLRARALQHVRFNVSDVYHDQGSSREAVTTFPNHRQTVA